MMIGFLALLAAFLNKKWGFFLAFLATLSLIIFRIILLERPPVATLTESALFIATILLALTFYVPPLGRILSLIAAFLLFISPLSNGAIAPVLRSSFWLTIHVLTVVTSYALLIGASAIAHYILLKKNALLEKSLERLLSWGTILLIIGTLLGGVWASTSWGRFWDWDPKETWAFTSISLYLIGLHAWHYGKIEIFGLSLFAILAGTSITFTWYGLNVLINKGLHTYGFTDAPVMPYLVFIFAEVLFCTFICCKKIFAKK